MDTRKDTRKSVRGRTAMCAAYMQFGSSMHTIMLHACAPHPPTYVGGCVRAELAYLSGKGAHDSSCSSVCAHVDNTAPAQHMLLSTWIRSQHDCGPKAKSVSRTRLACVRIRVSLCWNGLVTRRAFADSVCKTNMPSATVGARDWQATNDTVL